MEHCNRGAKATRSRLQRPTYVRRCDATHENCSSNITLIFLHFFWYYELLLILLTAGCGSGVTIGRPFLYAFIMAGITPWCDTTHEIQDICFRALYTQPLFLSYILNWHDYKGYPAWLKYNAWVTYSFWHPGNLQIHTVRCIVFHGFNHHQQYTRPEWQYNIC